jgi:hypothetical protein
MKPINEQSPKLPKGRFNALADSAQQVSFLQGVRFGDQRQLSPTHVGILALLPEIAAPLVDTSEPRAQQERATGVASYLTYRVCTSRCLTAQQFPAT